MPSGARKRKAFKKKKQQQASITNNKGFSGDNLRGIDEHGSQYDRESDGKMIWKHEPEILVLFDFKDYGSDSDKSLQYAAIQFYSGTMHLHNGASGYVDIDEDGKYDYSEVYRAINKELEKRKLVGIGIHKDFQRWIEACKSIGQKPPEPTALIDLSLFLSSSSKLAKVAFAFGLGETILNNSCRTCWMNLKVLRRCGQLKSLVEELDGGKAIRVDGYHPLLAHIIDRCDVTASFRGLQKGK